MRVRGEICRGRYSSGHRLFISAFMIASKVIYDDTYSNKSWCIVGQGTFALQEINQIAFIVIIASTVVTNGVTNGE